MTKIIHLLLIAFKYSAFFASTKNDGGQSLNFICLINIQVYIILWRACCYSDKSPERDMS